MKARFNKIKNYSNIENKRAVILGKGISLEQYTYNKEKDIVFSLNTAALCLDVIDFLVLNDIETINKFVESGNIKKVKNIILPIQLHKNETVSSILCTDVLDIICEKDITLYTYKLFTQRNKEILSNDSFDKFGFKYSRILSTLHVASQWSIMAGFKNIQVYGCSMSPEYSEVFEKNDDCGNLRSRHWYVQNYNILLNILNDSKIEYNIHSLI
jgi:hypothetical protein